MSAMPLRNTSVWRLSTRDDAADTVRQRPLNLGASRMAKILVLTGSFVGGTIGWWLGAFVGTMTAFMISMVGTGVGVYVGRRIANEFV